MPDKKDYFTVRDLASATGLTVQRIRQMCQAGDIPGASKPFTKDWLVPADKAIEWLMNRRGKL